MNTKRCDICKKVLDEQNDEYYTVGEISFHTPKMKRKTVMFRGEDGEEHGRTESWMDWKDRDFCVACWDKSSIPESLGVNLKDHEK